MHVPNATRLVTKTPERSPDGHRAAEGSVPQYGAGALFAVWAAAALPMATLAWVVAPRLAGAFGGPAAFPSALIACLTAGLLWQLLLVVALVWREQRSLRWSVVREALWLRAPRSPRTGRVGGRVWWMVLPFVVVLAAEEFVPDLPAPAGRDFAEFVGSTVGQNFLAGAWGWFAVLVLMGVLNTVLGEELLFRGFLLPRMNRAFGRGDWLANGVLFGLYHLHMPWAIPASLLGAVSLAYPTKRYRSAWMGIVVHSTQTVFLTIAILPLVI